MDSRRIRFALLFLTATLCAPLLAQPVANTTTVTFQYSAGGQAPQAQTVTFSGSAVTSARISQNFDANGNIVNSAADNSGVFIDNVAGNTVNIGLASAILATLATKGQNTYTGTLLVSGNACSDCVTITMTLQIGSNGSVTVLQNGQPIPTGGITLTSAVFASAQTTLTLQGATSGTFNVTTSQPGWLTVSPTSGTFGGPSGSAIITVTANASGSGIVAGANLATITFATSLGTPQIPVTFNVGQNTLTLSPSSMAFSYATASQVYTPGQSQTVIVSGAALGTQFTANVANPSLSPWLSVNSIGQSSFTGVMGTSGTGVPVFVNPIAIGNPPAANVYTGQINFTDGGQTATMTVTLTVSASSANPTLTFNVATSGGVAPAAQALTISGNGTYSALPSTNNGGSGWITVTPAFGSLSGSVTLSVSVTPGTLPAGVYTGFITISLNGVFLQSTNVTMNIGGGVSSTGSIVSPTTLTFQVPPGGSQTQYVIVNSNASSTYSVTSFNNAFSVSPSSGPTPQVVAITANAATPGINPGANTSSVSVTSGSTTIPINLNLNVNSGEAIYASPAAYATLSTSGNLPNLAISSTQDSAGGIPFTITAPSFVTLSSSPLNTPSTFAVAINSNLLQPGFNSGNIVITSVNAGDSPLSVPITILAPGTTPGLTASPNPLNLTGTAGGSPVQATINVSGLTGTTFTAAASSTLPNNATGAWLTVQPTSNITSPATLNITANPLSLFAGTTYTGSITLTASNGTSVVVSVNFTVTAQQVTLPLLSASTNSLTFNYRQGDPAPGAQAVQLNSSGGNVSFTVSTSASWITASPTSGNAPASLSIAVDPTKLPAGTGAGTQTGSVTVTAPSGTATGSPQVIQVSLNITNPPLLTVTTNALSFSYVTGGTLPGTQSVQVGSTGSSLAFTVSASSAPWLTISPTSSTTPASLSFSVDPSKVGAGNFLATVTINAAGTSQTINVAFSVSAPLPTITAVYNAASSQAGPIAPGEMIVITGTNMGPDPLVSFTATNGIVDSTLANTRVLVGGFAATMIYTSSTQVSAVVPYEIAGKLTTFVQVQYLGQGSNTVTLNVSTTAPGIFTLNSSGSGPALVVNQDGSVNSDSNPAAQNSVILLYATGEGVTLPAGVNGKVANDPNSLPQPILTVTATVNHEPVTVNYAGAAPGFVAGVMQVNLQLPPDATSGDVVLTIGPNSSPPGTTVSIH